MTANDMKEEFTKQQKECLEKIRTLETDLQQQKELYLKLQGAIEALEILKVKENEQKETTAAELAEALTGLPAT